MMVSDTTRARIARLMMAVVAVTARVRMTARMGTYKAGRLFAGIGARVAPLVVAALIGMAGVFAFVAGVIIAQKILAVAPAIIGVGMLAMTAVALFQYARGDDG